MDRLERQINEQLDAMQINPAHREWWRNQLTQAERHISLREQEPVIVTPTVTDEELDAVALVAIGWTHSRVAYHLGVRKSAIGEWVRAARESGHDR